MARKKKNRGEGKGADVGVIMTCSLFLIILTFFILLNSIAVIDDRKQRLAIGSLIGSFGTLSGGLSKMSTGESMMPAGAPMVKDALDLNTFLKNLNDTLMEQVRVQRRREKGTIAINEAALFEAGTHVLKPGPLPVLDKLSRFINAGDYPIEIVGHTDNRSPGLKGYASNWELTGLMAMQVHAYLVAKGGVAPARITAYGRGDREPVASNDTRESRRLNRRVEVVLKFKASEPVKQIFEDRPSGNFTYKRFNFKVF